MIEPVILGGGKSIFPDDGGCARSSWSPRSPPRRVCTSAPTARRRVGFRAMATRAAACHCGQLRLDVTGDPFVVSICHCLACQRRTGSAFGMQAAFTAEAGRGDRSLQRLRADLGRGGQQGARLPFLPRLRVAGLLTEPTEPDLIVVSVGSFADPSFPPPTESGYDSSRHQWVEASRHDPAVRTRALEPARPLYEAGRYADAAEVGRELLAAHPDQAHLYYNVACCESLAGRDGQRPRAPA